MHRHKLQPHITANYCNQTLSSAFGQRAQGSKSKTALAGVAQNNPAWPSTAQHSSVQPSTTQRSPAQLSTVQHVPARPSTVHRFLCEQPRCLGQGPEVPPPACPCSKAGRRCPIGHLCQAPQSLAGHACAWPHCGPGAVLAPSAGWQGLGEAAAGHRWRRPHQRMGQRLCSLASGRLCGDGTALACWCRALCGGGEHSSLFAFGLRLLSTSQKQHLCDNH